MNTLNGKWLASEKGHLKIWMPHQVPFLCSVKRLQGWYYPFNDGPVYMCTIPWPSENWHLVTDPEELAILALRAL